jgi:hypothetical protein
MTATIIRFPGTAATTMPPPSSYDRILDLIRSVPPRTPEQRAMDEADAAYRRERQAERDAARRTVQEQQFQAMWNDPEFQKLYRDWSQRQQIEKYRFTISPAIENARRRAEDAELDKLIGIQLQKLGVANTLSRRRDPSAPPLTAIAKALRPTELSQQAYERSPKKRRRALRLKRQRYVPR